MSQITEPSIRVRVDPTNPGQFFACCGLLELADRLWEGAEGWFEDSCEHFCIRPEHEGDSSHGSIIYGLSRCKLTNTMTNAQIERREELAAMPKREREGNTSLEAEKGELDKLWREAPIILHEPFSLRVDWFIDDRAGGETFKTWAGQQSVVDIACGMKAPIEAGDWDFTPPEDWLFQTTNADSLPFYFDSDIGEVGSDLDVGFAFDPLKIRVRTRPLLELGAFIGFQRFRPERIGRENRYIYSPWFDPLVPAVCSAAACGVLRNPKSQAFEFRFIYRTKYLKSFLSANPIERRER